MPEQLANGFSVMLVDMIIVSSAATARARYGLGGEGVYLDVPAVERRR